MLRKQKVFIDSKKVFIDSNMKGWYNIIRDRKEGKGWQNKVVFLMH